MIADAQVISMHGSQAAAVQVYCCLGKHLQGAQNTNNDLNILQLIWEVAHVTEQTREHRVKYTAGVSYWQSLQERCDLEPPF